jgi:hypothetical protein
MWGQLIMTIVSLDWDKMDDTYNQELIFPGTVTWIASEAGLASNADNWSGGVTPRTGDDVIFDATSVNNCLWDLDASEVTVNSITIATGYTGTVTQGDVDIGIGDGGLIANSDTNIVMSKSKSIISSGDILIGNSNHTGGNIVFVSDANMSMQSWALTSLTIRDNCKLTIEKQVLTERLFIAEDAQVIVPYDALLRYYLPKADNYRNDGEIIGDGTFSIELRFNDASLSSIGDVQTDILVRIYPYQQNRDYILTLNDDLSTPRRFSIIGHSTYSINIDINGHSLNANGITVGMNGGIVGDGKIINAGDFDASAGSFSFTGQYVQAGDGTIKLAEGQKFNELLCIAPTKLASDIIVDDILAYVHPIDKGAFNITNDRTKEYTGPRRPFMMPLKRRRLSNPSYHSLMEFIWYD